LAVEATGGVLMPFFIMIFLECPPPLRLPPLPRAFQNRSEEVRRKVGIKSYLHNHDKEATGFITQCTRLKNLLQNLQFSRPYFIYLSLREQLGDDGFGVGNA